MTASDFQLRGLAMENEINPKEGFRKGFVLTLTFAYSVAFLAMLSGFFEALLLAAVISGLTYPLYRWLLHKLGGRSTPASLLTLVITLFAILIPLSFLLALVAEQALAVAQEAKPWIAQQLAQSGTEVTGLPEWVPFGDRLEPYRNEIMAKLGELASASGALLAGILSRLSEGTVVFFFQLFIMLYAMFFFLTDGPALVNRIMCYAPLSRADRQKMLDVALSVSRATIRGALLIGVIQGTLAGIGFAVVGIEAAAFWGAIMAVLSILPGIGAPLVWVPAVIYLLMSGDFVAGIGLLVWSGGVVGSIDNFLRPVLVGRDTKMPDLLILLSTLGGIAWFGAIGLVAGPLLAALFLTVLAMYSRVFGDWLNVEDRAPSEESPR
jgi:predicted PurR-regulated permease PerM